MPELVPADLRGSEEEKRELISTVLTLFTGRSVVGVLLLEQHMAEVVLVYN